MPQTFNEKELLERVDNDVEFLGDALQMLETDGRSLLAELKAAVAAADAAGVGRLGHTLKGMISNFCAPSAQSLALEVERAGKAGDCAAAAAAAERIEPALESLIAELDVFVRARA